LRRARCARSPPGLMASGSMAPCTCRVGSATGASAWLPDRAAGLVPVIAVLGAERVEADSQVRPISGGAKQPGAVTARRPVLIRGGERVPRRPRAFLTLGTGASVPDGVSLPVG